MSNILVTGGAGYIGSHTLVELLTAGHSVTVVENFCNSSQEAVRRVEQITGEQVPLHEVDIRDKTHLQPIIDDGSFDAVIHFAALKAVGEAQAQPLRYYDNNVGGTLTLIECLQDSTVRKLIFSSSATVYGDQPIPYTEQTPCEPSNVYGRTKYMSELIMADAAAADPKMAMIALRYFNPIGAHPSGLIGEDPSGTPNNLMPYAAQVAAGRRDRLQVFGNDYPTPDGTGVRDYIHVVDLAKGHLAALERGPSEGFHAYNLGSGHGASVLEVIRSFETASGKPIPYDFVPRRAGDLAEYYADPALAQAELGWHTTLSLDDACRDTWNWQSHNPDGYRGANPEPHRSHQPQRSKVE